MDFVDFNSKRFSIRNENQVQAIKKLLSVHLMYSLYMKCPETN